MRVTPQEVTIVATHPCDACGRRFRGRARFWYPTLLGDNDDGERKRLRLCELDSGRLELFCQHFFVVTVEGDESEYATTDSCVACETPQATDMLYQVFITDYHEANSRRDWWGTVCATHSSWFIFNTHRYGFTREREEWGDFQQPPPAA